MALVRTPILNPRLPNLPLEASWFYTLWWLHWSIFTATSVYSPLRLQATTYSPYAWIILSWAQSATPSGIPQYEPRFIFVPRLKNSSDNTEEDNLRNPFVRATISHTPLGFQNYQATTLSGHVLPEYKLHS